MKQALTEDENKVNSYSKEEFILCNDLIIK